MAVLGKTISVRGKRLIGELVGFQMMVEKIGQYLPLHILEQVKQKKKCFANGLEKDIIIFVLLLNLTSKTPAKAGVFLLKVFLLTSSVYGVITAFVLFGQTLEFAADITDLGKGGQVF